MRNKQAAFALVKLIQQQSKDVAFYGVRETRLANGQYSCYLAFLEISIPKASTHALDIGKFVNLSWYDPEIEQKDPPQSKWKGPSIPALSWTWFIRELDADAPLAGERWLGNCCPCSYVNSWESCRDACCLACSKKLEPLGKKTRECNKHGVSRKYSEASKIIVSAWDCDPRRWISAVLSPQQWRWIWHSASAIGWTAIPSHQQVGGFPQPLSALQVSRAHQRRKLQFRQSFQIYPQVHLQEIRLCHCGGGRSGRDHPASQRPLYWPREGA